jgi:hypothetical protein
MGPNKYWIEGISERTELTPDSVNFRASAAFYIEKGRRIVIILV